MTLQGMNRRMMLAAAFSLAVHSVLLFAVHLSPPDLSRLLDKPKPLEVTLVNSQSKHRPDKADAYAQANLDGGGNTPKDRRASSPLPALGDDQNYTPEQNARRLQQLEQENLRLMTQVRNDQHITTGSNAQPRHSNDGQGLDSEVHSLEIARLEAQIAKEYEAYQKLPRRKFIGARTREYRFAQYVEDWRAKIERIGSLNVPEQASRNNIYGKLQMTVAVRADGTVEKAVINRSSGQPILDDAALRIVNLAAPYPQFPPEIRRDTDIIEITRTWSFTQGGQLQGE